MLPTVVAGRNQSQERFSVKSETKDQCLPLELAVYKTSFNLPYNEHLNYKEYFKKITVTSEIEKGFQITGILNREPKNSVIKQVSYL